MGLKTELEQIFNNTSKEQKRFPSFYQDVLIVINKFLKLESKLSEKEVATGVFLISSQNFIAELFLELIVSNISHYNPSRSVSLSRQLQSAVPDVLKKETFIN